MEDLVQATAEVEHARSVDRLAGGSTSDPARAARGSAAHSPHRDGSLGVNVLPSRDHTDRIRW